MAKSSVKIPMIFIYLLLVPAALMLIGICINAQIVGVGYFVALLINFAFMIIDIQFKSSLTNYKLSFSLAEVINLISVIAIFSYEINNLTLVLNVFLILLIVLNAVMLLIDGIFLKNQKISKLDGSIVSIFKIGSMVCILMYFYKVSTLWFAISAFIFELISLSFKIYLCAKKTKVVDEKMSDNETIEDIIHSAGENEGEVE